MSEAVVGLWSRPERAGLAPALLRGAQVMGLRASRRRSRRAAPACRAPRHPTPPPPRRPCPAAPALLLWDEGMPGSFLRALGGRASFTARFRALHRKEDSTAPTTDHAAHSSRAAPSTSATAADTTHFVCRGGVGRGAPRPGVGLGREAAGGRGAGECPRRPAQRRAHRLVDRAERSVQRRARRQHAPGPGWRARHCLCVLGVEARAQQGRHAARQPGRSAAALCGGGFARLCRRCRDADRE